ncbi:hypothetical protein HDU97_002005 [Phlyctochytrium planicorne]|nr:hypothetical protein HDU97_002005 [Phlyctochytrium planicorne]
MSNGTVLVYGLGGLLRQFSLGERAREYGVVDCKFWGKGFVALTGDYRFVSVADFTEPRPKYLAEFAFRDQPTTWCIIPPTFSLSRHVEVLAATGNSICAIDLHSSQDQFVSFGPFLSIQLSPDGKFLALFSSDGRLSVVSTDFQRNLAEFSTGSKTPPLSVAWCGSDAVVLHWKDTILVVGPFGDWIKYTVDGEVQLRSEIDGVRIVSKSTHSFLQRVPILKFCNLDAVEQIFKVGSTSAGAILFDAFDSFEKRNPKADEGVKSIRPQMSEAVEACLEAALNEIDIPVQKKLLQAASFGKAYIFPYDASRFVKVCDVLRVLNAVRSPDIGISISFPQFLQLGPDALIDRLLGRNFHNLAYSCSSLLKIPTERIIVDWACKKIDSLRGGAEDVLPNMILEFSQKTKSKSVIEVARKAFLSGFTKLGVQLVEYEPKAAFQVPLLLSMEQDEKAINKAIESGDSDLVYSVLLFLKRKHPIAEYFRLLHGKPNAIALLEKYSREQDLQLLKDFFYQDDQRVSRANVIVMESFEQTALNGKVSKLKEAVNIYSEEKEKEFEKRILDDQVKLIQAQAGLERELGSSFANMSLWKANSKHISALQISGYLIKMGEFEQTRIFANLLLKTPSSSQEGSQILSLLNNR